MVNFISRQIQRAPNPNFVQRLKYAFLFLLCWQLQSTAREGARMRDEDSKVNPGVLLEGSVFTAEPATPASVGPNVPTYIQTL